MATMRIDGHYNTSSHEPTGGRTPNTMVMIVNRRAIERKTGAILFVHLPWMVYDTSKITDAHADRTVSGSRRMNYHAAAGATS